MIKAIETVYKGYRFRSRLEARWAVFFDNFGLNYQYESEGFDLDGTWYLPDFHLPEYDLWLEIKPPELPDLEAQKKAVLLHWAKQKELNEGKFKQNVGIICGSPWFPKLSLGSDGLKILDGYIILIPIGPIDIWSVECFKGNRDSWDIWPIYFDDGFDGFIDLRTIPPFTQKVYQSLVFPYQWMDRIYIGAGDSYATTDLTKAYQAARQARF